MSRTRNTAHLRLAAAIPLALVAALLAPPATVLGATRTPSHVNFTTSWDDVVCGIPVHVLEVGQVTETEFIDKDGSYQFRGTLSRTTTYTAANGASVSVSDANQLNASDPLVDEEAGTITFVNTLRGVLEKMKLSNGRILFVDAGYATDAITFDLVTGDFVSFEHLVFHGRDPLADSGFALWCEAFTEGLA